MAVQLPLGLSLREGLRFASYFPGRNAEVLAALRAVRKGEPPLVVWLHGGAGVGKTHLLQSICAQAGLVGERATYLPLVELADRGSEILAGCGSLDWVCLDDVERVIGRSSWEHELFKLHGELEDSRSHLIVASHAAPVGLSFSLPDLASRMSGGLVLKLAALDDDDLSSALQLRAELRGLELGDDVAQFILRRLPRELTVLCDFLDLLDRESLAAQRRLTVPFVAALLDGGTSGA